MNIPAYNNYNNHREGGQAEKAVPQAFTGYKSKFSRELEQIISKKEVVEGDKKRIIQLLKEAVDRTLSNSRFLGQGKSNIVFKLDDKHVIRTGLSSGITINDFKIIPKTFENLKTYYGKIDAQFGTVCILKNALIKNKGLNAGVPINMKKPADIIKYYKEVYLPEFSSLPQRAYDNIAIDFSRLNQMKDKNRFYKFDTVNPNNFIKTGKSIRIVDVIQNTDIENFNNLSEMMDLFVRTSSVNAEIGFDRLMVPMRRNIFKKCILAGIKADLPFVSEPSGYSNLEKCTRLSGYKTKFSEIRNKISDINKQFPNMKQRLAENSKYLDTLK